MQTVIHVLARAPIDHRSGPFQLGEMAGNAGLAHPQNFLELGHGKLLLLEKEEEAEARGIGDEAKEVNR